MALDQERSPRFFAVPFLNEVVNGKVVKQHRVVVRGRK